MSVTQKINGVDAVTDILNQAVDIADAAVSASGRFNPGFGQDSLGFGRSELFVPLSLPQSYQTIPEVYKLHNISTQERENNPNPALYVWSPTETSFERFSADGNRLIRDGSVEIIVASLDPATTVNLTQDTVDVLGNYIADHHDKTDLRTVEPESATDDRASTVFRHTDHYTGTVSVSSQVLQQVA
jgi:hypothetical protein